MKFWAFILKSIPYLLSIAGGAVIFFYTVDNIRDPQVQDLVLNISASLLAIPLVFLLYDYSNYLVSRQVKKSLENTMSGKMNLVMLSLILALRQILGMHTRLTLNTLNKMLATPATEIVRKLRITPIVLNNLRTIHDDFDELLYRSGQSNVFSTDQFQALSAITREMSHLINENKYRKNKGQSAKHIENIMTHITDWLDADTVAALHLEQNLSITSHITSGKNTD
ncbi:MAG: hypothetical protein IJX89_01330 [Alphaproteobacteria bacterium]|nr:hypothetical protein [Alphaproteobacteria bacterium]